MSVPGKKSYIVQAVDKALSILEAISEETDAFGLSQLSSKLGMDKSYVFRMLSTFEQRGYVQKIGSSGRYRAGLAAYETGGKFFRHLELLQKAKPLLDMLAVDSREAVYLAIPGEQDLLLIAMADSPQQVRVISFLGKRFALQKISAGRVLLATISNVRSRNRSPLLRSVRSCRDWGAIGEGIGSLAVPVFDSSRNTCASLCLIVPEFRFDDERIDARLLPLLKRAGEKLSAKLGYFHDEPDVLELA